MLVLVDDWVKLKPYSKLTSLSLDFGGNVYGEVYKDMRLMLRWLTDVIAPALPQKMPSLQKLILKLRTHTIHSQPHFCRKNYHCRDDDPRDGTGYWSRLGFLLGRCSDLEKLKVEIHSISYYGLAASTRRDFAHMVMAAVLNNGLPGVGYRVEVVVGDSLSDSSL